MSSLILMYCSYSRQKLLRHLKLDFRNIAAFWYLIGQSFKHCVKSIRIRSYSGSFFPAFGLNKERYVSLPIQSKYGKMWTRITPNTDTFYVVKGHKVLPQFCHFMKSCMARWYCFSFMTIFAQIHIFTFEASVFYTNYVSLASITFTKKTKLFWVSR